MSNDPAYSFGIEEEYFLVDVATRALIGDPPRELLERCRAALGEQFSSEYHRSQVEVATKVCTTSADARTELLRLRRAIATTAEHYRLALMAASTHPFTLWKTQTHTDKRRYRAIADELKGVGRRMVIGGMHVHVAIDDKDERIAVMNAMRVYLPMLLALSTSSPFWQGENTGLKSYRTAINDAVPRNGIPEQFINWQDFQAALAPLVRSGVIEDATKIWWDLRPSARFPTLELRITDICPLIDDALCIAALFRCLCRCVHKRLRRGETPPSHPLLLLNENRWRAQRYGLDGGFIDAERNEILDGKMWIDRLLQIVGEDAQHFGCASEVHHARTILRRGTSADRQLSAYYEQLDAGSDQPSALRTVVDQVLRETLSAC